MKNSTFNEVIKNARQSLDKGLRELAREINLSPSYLSRMEAGDFPPPSEEVIIKLAKVLKIDSDELLALANKIDPMLKDKINQEPKLYAAFLRKASIDDIKKCIKQIDD